ncbi:MAG: 1-deoxy-D-xylulose-5-phosphate reductoisomerase [Syntrophomonadaceae bacterium]
MTEPSQVVVLGSTGSIGRQTLEVIERYGDRYQVLALAARDEVEPLVQQIQRFKPRYVAVGDDKAYSLLKRQVGSEIQVVAGIEGLCEIAALPEAEISLVALSGAVGIMPTIAAVQAGKRVALANKETLVAAGDLVMNKVKESGVQLLPVDSEHSAIFQCLAGEERNLEKIWLTASGGPFRDYTRQQLEGVTVDMALRHPNWAMGPKITIDSATLMNKGLEVIEAYHLFQVDYSKIEVLIQRESIIHSMVELKDGAFLAHLGVPDMRIPIQYALTYPDRMESLAQSLDFSNLPNIHFDRPDLERFPSLDLAYQAGRAGGTMPAVLNAANEVAVQAFLDERIAFTRIPFLVEAVMLKHDRQERPDLPAIMEADSWARRICAELI